jgi:hypothetical protein
MVFFFSFSLEVGGCGHPLFLFLFLKIFTKKKSPFLLLFFFFSLFQEGCDHLALW